MDGGLGKLGINLLILIAQIVNFLILLWILNRFLYKPLLKLFRDRSDKIEEGLKKAEEMKTQALEAEAEHRKYLDEARKQAQQIIAQATELGDLEEQKIIQVAKEEARKIVERTMIEIKNEKKNIMQDVKKEIGEMIVSLSTTMVKKTIDEKTQKKLLNEALKEVERELEKTRKST
jgi:F-type H+-transporting ATPase subunit b